MNYLTIVLLLLLAQTGFCKFKKRSDSLRSKKGSIVRPVIFATGGVALWGLTYRYLDSPIQKFSQAHQFSIPEFTAKYTEPLGRGYYLVPANIVMYLTGAVLQDKKLAKAGAAGLTAFVMNDFASIKLKCGFERHRPNTGSPYNTFDGPDGNDSNRSFPSSHTSNIFSTATVVASIYKDSKWVPPVAYGFASLVGFSRIYTNHHWASDVLAGAAIGFICGKLSVAGWNWLEKKHIAFFPSFGKNKNSLTLIHQF